jgi:hypothetical protein
MLTVEKTNRKDYNSNMTEYPMILKIISAEYIKDYKIKFRPPDLGDFFVIPICKKSPYQYPGK